VYCLTIDREKKLANIIQKILTNYTVNFNTYV